MDNSIEFLKSHESLVSRPLGEEEDTNVLTAKVILIGDSSVGKTSILYRYMQNQFLETPNITLGLELSIKKLQLENNESIVLNIWDSAGQEKYRSLTYHFYRGVNGIILVFDVNNTDTFKNLTSWLTQINKHAPENVDIVLVGNKSDDENEENSVWKNNEELLNIVKKYRLTYFETSAKNGKNINKIFNVIAKLIKNRSKIETLIRKESLLSPSRYKLSHDKKKEDPVILKLSKKEKKKESGNCCL